MTGEPQAPATVEAGEPHVHLPAPSIWPVILAFGVTLLAFGVIASLVFSAVGLALFVCALVGWVGELRHEQ